MRAVTVDDADEIAELEMKLFPENCFNEKTLATEITLGKGYIVEDRYGHLMAYALIRGDRNFCDVTRLGVHPDVQGRGLGTKMLKQALGETHKVMLTVRSNNAGALRLYQKLGFEIVGQLNDGSWVMQTVTSSAWGDPADG